MVNVSSPALVTDVRSGQWFCDCDEDGNVVDVPMSSFTQKLVRSALAVSELLPSNPVIHPLSHVVKHWR